VNTGHVEAVLAGVPGSAGTRHRVLATVRGALNAAVRARQIMYNPASGIEMEPEDTPEAKRWTPEQVTRFLTYTADDPMGLMFRVAVLRGPRRAELCGFRWAGSRLDVPYRDPVTGEMRHGAALLVARPILQLGGKLHEEATAKSRAGDCVVFLDHGTAELLRAHKPTRWSRIWSVTWRAPPGPTAIWCSASPTGGRGTRTTCPSGSGGWPGRRACQ